MISVFFYPRHYNSLFSIALIFLVSCQGDQQEQQEADQQTDVTGNLERALKADFTGIFTAGKDYHRFKSCASYRFLELQDPDSLLAGRYDSLGLAYGTAMFVRFDGDSVSENDDHLALRVENVIEAKRFNGQTPCLPDSLSLSFQGNEPFWSLKISTDSIVFKHFERPASRFPYRRPRWQDSVWVFTTERADTTLVAYLSETDCRDDMSGFRYAMRAQIEIARETYRGCGGREGREPEPQSDSVR
jgi:uncharacterized membrane protein